MVPKSSQELRNSVAINDRRFRLAQTAFMVVVVVALVGISLLEYSIIERQQKDAHERQDQIISLQSAIQRKVDQQNKMIECIAQFFTQANRQDKVIVNLEQCSVSPTNTSGYVAPKLTTPAFKPTQVISKSSAPPAPKQAAPAPQKSKSILSQVLGSIGL